MKKHGQHTVTVDHEGHGCTKVYTCGKNTTDNYCNTEAHSHDSSCPKDASGNYTCGKSEHSHSASCKHTHDNNCWSKWSCGATQASPNYIAWDYTPKEKTMYLKADYTWTEKESEAFEFKTDKNGEIKIETFKFQERILEHQGDEHDEKTEKKKDYFAKDPKVTAIETSNPYYGYEHEVNREYPIKLNADKTTISDDKQILENTQKKLKLSGYVWVEEQQGKTSEGNNIYDSGEKGLDGVKVSLKDSSGAVKKSVWSGDASGIYDINGGQWQMEITQTGAKDVSDPVLGDLSELASCYIEFEYCGVTYQCVPAVIDSDVGSKALDTNSRATLDNAFANVVPNGTNSIKTTGNGNEGGPVTITYQGTSDHKNSFSPTEGKTSANDDHGGHNMTGCDVYATTNKAGYNIWSHYSPTVEEIKYINLGVFRKAQTDYAIIQDLYTVRTSINGYSHIYTYGLDTEAKGNWNDLGVRFQANNGTYNRAVYQADYTYKNDGNGDDELLKVYLTYKLTLRNESTYAGKINTIDYYFDKRGKIVEAGYTYYNYDDHTDKDNKIGTIGDTVGKDGGTASGEYTKYVINTETLLQPGQARDLYIQFCLDKDTITSKGSDYTWSKMVSTDGNIKDPIKNAVTEISSYTTYLEDNKTVAVYDHDSCIGNVTVGNVDTYEDDTDVARAVQLVEAKARTLSGNVFIDSVPTNKTGEESVGDGVLNENQDNISKLCEKLSIEMYEIDEGFGYNTDTPDLSTIINSEDKKRAIKMLNKKDENIDKILDTNWKATLNHSTGEYNIEGYIPGNYVIIFKWGNEDYKVQYYQSTTYNDRTRENNPYWYRDSNVDTRNSDAMDRWNESDNNIIWNREGDQVTSTLNGYLNSIVNPVDSKDKEYTRNAIDNEMELVTTNILEDEIAKAYTSNSNNIKITQMLSVTPKLDLSTEKLTSETEGHNNGEAFNITNVDFGIVERPEQRVDLKKRVSSFKITLANGQVIADLTIGEPKLVIDKANKKVRITEPGKVTGTNNYTTYMGPAKNEVGLDPTDYRSGLLRTEMDTELLEGAQVEVTYQMMATNVSEIDYKSENYYKYREVPANNPENYVRYSITELLDYTDDSLNVDDGNWNQQSMDNKDDPRTGLKGYYHASRLERDYSYDRFNTDKVKFYLTSTMDRQLRPILESVEYRASDSNNQAYKQVNLHLSKLLTSTDNITYYNMAEIVEITKDQAINSGSPVRMVVDETNHFETAEAETIPIIPSTGEDKNYVLPISIGIIATITLGVGVYLIKKKVLDA